MEQSLKTRFIELQGDRQFIKSAYSGAEIAQHATTQVSRDVALGISHNGLSVDHVFQITFSTQNGTLIPDSVCPSQLLP